jgi:hypothetical protein
MSEDEANMTNTLTLEVKPWNGNPYSKRALACDNECSLCGRPMNYHSGYAVRRVDGRGKGIEFIPGQATFAPVEKKQIGREPAEWATCVGSHCAKQLPKEYKFSMNMLSKKYWEAMNRGEVV